MLTVKAKTVDSQLSDTIKTDRCWTDVSRLFITQNSGNQHSQMRVLLLKFWSMESLLHEQCLHLDTWWWEYEQIKYIFFFFFLREKVEF